MSTPKESDWTNARNIFQSETIKVFFWLQEFGKNLFGWGCKGTEARRVQPGGMKKMAYCEREAVIPYRGMNGCWRHERVVHRFDPDPDPGHRPQLQSCTSHFRSRLIHALTIQPCLFIRKWFVTMVSKYVVEWTESQPCQFVPPYVRTNACPPWYIERTTN